MPSLAGHVCGTSMKRGHILVEQPEREKNDIVADIFRKLGGAREGEKGNRSEVQILDTSIRVESDPLLAGTFEALQEDKMHPLRVAPNLR